MEVYFGCWFKREGEGGKNFTQALKIQYLYCFKPLLSHVTHAPPHTHTHTHTHTRAPHTHTVLFISFKPQGGIVHSITVYPSDFSLERTAEEDIAGSVELVPFFFGLTFCSPTGRCHFPSLTDASLRASHCQFHS